MGSGTRLREDAAVIGAAAIDAVRPELVLARRLAVVADELLVDGGPLAPPVSLASGRVVVVGAGKAAGGMAAGLAHVLAAAGIGPPRLSGLVSVPEGCGRDVPGIEVRSTRPATVNLPTPAVVAATRQMVGLLDTLGPDDLAVALISGGGSALLECPRPGVPLEELVAVTRFLSAAGAEITQINAVRRAVSDVKGGGLARACGAGRMLVLVLSDVIGNPLEAIASGPCLPASGGAAAANAVLEHFGVVKAGIAPRLVAAVRDAGSRFPAPAGRVSPGGNWTTPRGCRIEHVLLGDNATAVSAAAAAATRCGYSITVRQATAGVSETAEQAGGRLAREGLALLATAALDGRPRGIIEGGEAVVRLPADHGTGGRNQQTAAAALAEIMRARPWPSGLLITSLGTDGEDGPTTAAGGIVDAAVATRSGELHLDAAAAVARCDAYPLLAQADGLVVTGPTGTNVADVRLVLARP